MQCPAIGRRATADSEAIAPQPFALEARHFSEMAVLNREVRVLLQGVDKHDNLIGSVVFPSSDGTDAKPVDLGKELLDRGLAKVGLSAWLSSTCCPHICAEEMLIYLKSAIEVLSIVEDV